MGVTLENARSLVEDIGALQGEAIQMTCGLHSLHAQSFNALIYHL